MSVKILQGDCRAILKALPSESVDCIVTSPPYYGLRDYGTARWEGGSVDCDHLGPPMRTNNKPTNGSAKFHGGATRANEPMGRICTKCGAQRTDSQVGLEETPDGYVQELVGIFRECRRVLKNSGTLWLNLGDSYAGGKTGRTDGESLPRPKGGSYRVDTGRQRPVADGMKPKDLIGIPWLVAFALRNDGWVLRQEIIWQKPNPMPESVTDRCTKSHEQIFMFAKARWSGPEAGRFAHISDADARWLAALIDTEGSIVVKRVKHEGRADTFAPQVAMGGTSRALMDEFVRIVGHGNLMERPGQNAPMFCWQVANGIARDFLLRIYPWLLVKQRQARIGIYVDSLTYWRGGKKPERKQRSEAEHAQLVSLWERNKLCNQFGTPDLSDVPEPKFGKWSDCQRYFYDAEAIAEIAEDRAYASWSERRDAGEPTRRGFNAEMRPGNVEGLAPRDGKRNKRSVWEVATQPYSEAHFATFPPDLIEPCIKAGCPIGGTVFDPFGGAGTTGLVADRLQRNATLIELNPAYAELAHKRIHNDAPMFATVETEAA